MQKDIFILRCCLGRFLHYSFNCYMCQHPFTLLQGRLVPEVFLTDIPSTAALQVYKSSLYIHSYSNWYRQDSIHRRYIFIFESDVVYSPNLFSTWKVNSVFLGLISDICFPMSFTVHTSLLRVILLLMSQSFLSATFNFCSIFFCFPE